MVIENADDAIFVHHRDGELGAGLGIHQEVAGIGSDIGNNDRFTKSGGGADDAFTGRDAQFALDALAVFDIDAMTENVLGFVVEHDTENLVIDDALDEFGGAAEKFFDIEDGADFAADFVEKKKRFGLGTDFLEQAGVFNGDGESAGKQGEDILLIGGEVVEVTALDVEHAGTFAAQHEGNGEFGADAIDGIDVAGIDGDIADANGMSGGRGGAGNSLPDGDAKIFCEAGGIADGETVDEIVAVDHENAEEFVVDVTLDEDGSVRENLVEIERGVDLFADFRKGGDDFCGNFGLRGLSETLQFRVS